MSYSQWCSNFVIKALGSAVRSLSLAIGQTLRLSSEPVVGRYSIMMAWRLPPSRIIVILFGELWSVGLGKFIPKTLRLGLTASLVSQFFSREFCGKWDLLLTKISVRYIVKLSSLAICESHNLRDLQTSKIIIHSKKLVLDPKFSQDSCKTPELKLIMILASLATNFLFARLASLATKFVCETNEKRFLLRNLFLRDS